MKLIFLFAICLPGMIFSQVVNTGVTNPSRDSIYVSNYSSGNNGLPAGHLEDKEITDPDSDFEIVPNPSEGPFGIHFGEAKGDNIEINVYNVFGQQVFSMNSNGYDKVMIDPQDWENGVYLIHCNSKNSNIIKRLVISKR